MQKVAFYTLGCKVNQYETEAMAELFCNAGYDLVDFEDIADVYVINTCTVTNMSDRKSRQMIRRAVKRNPQAIVAVVGCYAQRAPQDVISIDGVDIVIGTNQRSNIVQLVEQAKFLHKPVGIVGNVKSSDAFEEIPISAYKGHNRAFVKIEDGCDRYCTYCIIPYVRGPVRSRDPMSIIDEIKRLSSIGFKEIVLTGIHVASYGKDIGNITLMDLLEMVHDINGIERIRLSSIEPTVLNNKFVNRIKALPKLCSHFHVSLQSGCDSVLRRMGRHYTTKQYKEIVDNLRSAIPYIGITTDIIVGFPGETDNEFEQTLMFAQSIGFSRIHVFPYSPRKGTPAAKLKDQIPPALKEKRAHIMMQLADRLKTGFMHSQENKILPVLFERLLEKNVYEGLTPNYIRVLAPASFDISGRIINVRLISVEDDYMKGDIEDGKLHILQDSIG